MREMDRYSWLAARCVRLSALGKGYNKKRDPRLVKKEYARAMVHIRFCLELHAMQVASGRYFLHKHPAQASS